MSPRIWGLVVLKIPGVPLSHRFMPTENDRVIKEAEGEKPTLASEVGFNPVTTLKIGNEKVFVRAVNNTQSRYLKPIALNGAVVLPIRGERVFEFGDDMKAQLSSKVANLAKPLTEPDSDDGFLGVDAPSIKPKSAASVVQTTKLLSDLAATTAAVRSFLKQAPPKTAAQVQTPVLERPQPALISTPTAVVTGPPPVPAVPTAAPLQPNPTTPVAQVTVAEAKKPQEDVDLVEAKAALEDRRAQLQELQRRQDSLLSQILNTSEAGEKSVLTNQLTTLKKSHEELSAALISLKSDSNNQSTPVLRSDSNGSQDFQRQANEWLTKIDQVIGKQQIILDYLEAKEERVKKQTELKKGGSKMESAALKVPATTEATKPEITETPNETLAALPGLASKLIETTTKPKVIINYKPINLPTVPVKVTVEPMQAPATPTAQPEPYQGPIPGSIPARVEIVETVQAAEKAEPSLSLPATIVNPILNQQQIADVVSKQLEAEKQRFEDEIRLKLERETEAKIEEQKKALELVQAKVEEQSDTVQPRSDSIVAFKSESLVPEIKEAPQEASVTEPDSATKAAEPTAGQGPSEAAPEAVDLEVAESKPSFDKGEAQKQIDQETIHKTLVQAEGKVSNLSLAELSAGEREQLMGRLRSLAKQSEVLRQYEDLQYQREKDRINEEIKAVLAEADAKLKGSEERALEQAERQKETEAARKAKIAKEVKELVEREKAKKSRTHNIVQAQPAYGKMIPPKVAFPNVINGVVRDAKGMLLSGVVMIIKDKSGEPVRALKSNKIGQFVISTPLPNGVYNIELEREDMEFDIVQVEAKGQIMNPIEIRSL